MGNIMEILIKSDLTGSDFQLAGGVWIDGPGTFTSTVLFEHLVDFGIIEEI